MRAIVTGGAGFIGSHLVAALLESDDEILVVDDFSTGDRSRIDRLDVNTPNSPELRQLDVAAPELLDIVRVWRPDVIYHLAAQISVRHSVSDPLTDARTNVVGTVNVLEAARAAGARKVVFTSSVATYGIPAALPVGAHATGDPRSPYAASKLAGETYLRMYRSLHGLDYTTLTLSNVYGPGQSSAGEAGVVAIFVDALLNGGPTTVFGDGEQTRDYVYVEDVVDALVRAGGQRGGGERFTIGTGVATSDRHLHTLVAGAVGVADAPVFASPRPGDLPAMVVDPEPARHGFGWIPRTSLGEGIKATVEWARDRQS